jgi:hypothetical protein
MSKNLLLVGLFLLLPVAAPAAPALEMEFGPRAGISVSPDQVFAGGQLSLSGFAPDWSFDPSLELGFGDDLTVIAVNLDGLYHLRLRGSDWRPYVGGGLGLAFASWDAPPGLRDHNDSDVGLNAVLGFRAPAGARHHWFTELRLGITDLPDLKVTGGFLFGR